jgi:hypothetical protein
MKTVTLSRSITSSAWCASKRRTSTSVAPAAIAAFMHPVIPNTCASGAEPNSTSSSVSLSASPAMYSAFARSRLPASSTRFGSPVVPDV